MYGSLKDLITKTRQVQCISQKVNSCILALVELTWWSRCRCQKFVRGSVKSVLWIKGKNWNMHMPMVILITTFPLSNFSVVHFASISKNRFCITIEVLAGLKDILLSTLLDRNMIFEITFIFIRLLLERRKASNYINCLKLTSNDDTITFVTKIIESIASFGVRPRILLVDHIVINCLTGKSCVELWLIEGPRL